MFSLPWSTAGASLLPGVVIIVIVVSLNAWTVQILVEAAEKFQAFDLGSLLSHLPGRLSRVAQVTNVAVWIVLFITQVGYIDVMSTAFMAMTQGTALHNRPLSVFLVSLAVLPVCFLNQKYLNFTSAMAVIINIYIFIVMTVQPKHTSTVCYVGAGTGSISMISVMMQAIVIQMCILPMYQELENRSPAKFRGVVQLGFGSLIFVFAGFAAMGYVVFGAGVSDNIIDALPDNTAGNIARVSAGLCMYGVFPIFLQAMVAPVWNANIQRKRFAYVMATTVTVALAMLVALQVEKIGFLNVINGAICSIAFVALCPSIVGLYLSDKRESRRWRAAMYTLLVFGSVAGVLGVCFTENYVQDVTSNCVWGAR